MPFEPGETPWVPNPPGTCPVPNEPPDGGNGVPGEPIEGPGEPNDVPGEPNEGLGADGAADGDGTEFREPDCAWSTNGAQTIKTVLNVSCRTNWFISDPAITDPFFLLIDLVRGRPPSTSRFVFVKLHQNQRP